MQSTSGRRAASAAACVCSALSTANRPSPGPPSPNTAPAAAGGSVPSKSWRTTPKPNSRSSTPARASRISAPASPASSRRTPSSRVLPIPAGPSKASTPPPPAASRASAAAIAASSSSRSSRSAGALGGRGRGGREQLLVERDQLRAGHRPELLAQQHAELVVGQDGLGVVAAPGQHGDQRRARGLAERRRGNRGAAGPLGLGQRLRIAQPGARHLLQRVDAQLLDVTAPRPQPGRVEIGQQSRGGERGGLARGRRIAGAGQLGDRLDVHPHRLAEGQPQRVAAFEHGGLDRAAQAREHGRERGVAGRRAFVGPQGLDQRVAADRAVAVQHEVGEGQAALPAAQLRLAACAEYSTRSSPHRWMRH